MSGAILQPKIQMIDGTDRCRLVETYRIPLLTRPGVVLEIDAGFEFDGASKPEFLWNIPFCGTPWDADTMGPSGGHDGLCGAALLPRDEADENWKRWCLANKVGRIRAEVFFQAVRVGAFVGYGVPHVKEALAARGQVRLLTQNAAQQAELDRLAKLALTGCEDYDSWQRAEEFGT